FTPVALGAFTLTATAGLLRGAQEVGSVHEVFGSSYGMTLLVKSLFVVVMVALSVLAWRRRLIVPRLESAVVVGVTAAAVLLAAYPLPPARLNEAVRAAGIGAQAPGLPQAGDLTLGGRAGTTLVGLTLSPGEPGRNDVLLYVLPLVGERSVPVALSIEEHHVALDSCGVTCRRAAVDLSGGERIEVRVGDSPGRVASFDVPQLPAPDGMQLFAQLEQRMHALTSYRLAQTLDSGTDTIRTTYECHAPDQVRARSSGGFQIVWIGGTEYLQRAPGEGWIVERGGSSFPVTSFVWDYVPDRVIDPRIVGAARPWWDRHHHPLVLRTARKRRLLVPVMGRPDGARQTDRDERARAFHEPALRAFRRSDHDPTTDGIGLMSGEMWRSGSGGH
ncbi:MAG: CopD family protein, partial [Actinomycetota bacterium]|nr:CopD family protein [Actinomycetota bacterium]